MNDAQTVSHPKLVKYYKPLKSRSSKIGDEYYRCIVDRLMRKDPNAVHECTELARQYKSALHEQLRDLERLTDPAFVERERNIIMSCLLLLDQDLDALSRNDIDQLRHWLRTRRDQ